MYIYLLLGFILRILTYYYPNLVQRDKEEPELVVPPKLLPLLVLVVVVLAGQIRSDNVIL